VPDTRPTSLTSPVTAGLDAAIDTRNLSGAFALLAEMSQDFADTLDLDATLLRALKRIAAHLEAEAGSLWLVDREAQRILCKASVGANPITGVSVGIEQGIIGRSVRANRSQNILDVASDPDFARQIDDESSLNTCSLLCAPLSFSDQALGAIELVNKRSESRRFTKEDGHLLQVLAASAALAISNARMAEAVAEHQRVKRELELAAEIQRNLLPAPMPEPFPIRGANVPARTVSGDFYDVLPLADGRLAFCLGDVSGKGIRLSGPAPRASQRRAGRDRHPGHVRHHDGRRARSAAGRSARVERRPRAAAAARGRRHLLRSARRRPAPGHPARGGLRGPGASPGRRISLRLLGRADRGLLRQRGARR
jgi:putative methionine-R-sulfoxide reductase with GAF domain